MNARNRKIVTYGLSVLAVAGIGAGIFVGQKDSGTSNLANQPKAGSTEPGVSQSASTGTGSGTDTPTVGGSASPGPVVTSAAPNSNSNSVIDSGAKDVISRFGQDRYNKVIQFADMYAGLAQGDCSRLSGQNDGTVALTALYTPESLPKVLKNKSAALIDVSKSGLKFNDTGCSKPRSTTWAVTVEGKEDPIIWLKGTVRTDLYPTNDKPFEAAQNVELGVVEMPGSQFGWQIQKSNTSTVVTTYLDEK